MGAAAAPMLIGSAIGGLTNRKNPLQGALLGGVLGGAGGAFMSGAGGLSSLLPSFGSAAAPTTAGSLMAAAPTVAGPTTAAFTGQAVTPAMSTIFANPTAAIGGTSVGGGASTGLINSALAPSFMDQMGSGLGSVGKYATQNPTLTNQALQSAQQAMQQPEAQFAPAGQVNRGQIQGGDYMSLLNPQQGTVLRPQPISLLG
jgi:hypothetical protein